MPADAIDAGAPWIAMLAAAAGAVAFGAAARAATGVAMPIGPAAEVELRMLLDAATSVAAFVIDLASLTSIYRVASFIVLGLLLLCGAFAWQRVRPRPLPDLRGMPKGLR